MYYRVKHLVRSDDHHYIYPSLPAESWRAQWGETLSFLKKHFYYHLNPAFRSLHFAYNFVKRPKQSIKFVNI